MYKQHYFLIFLLISLVLTGCTPPATIQSDKADLTERIAIISAFEPEITRLVKEAELSETYEINGRSFHTGKLAGKDVILFQSGVSMVNAAMTTQLALDHFQVSAIVFTGIAGGVNPDLHIGDVVIPGQWGQYQEQLFARETGEGWDLGWRSKTFENFGMMFPQDVSLTHKNGKTDKEASMFWFPVNSDMLQVAQSAAENTLLETCSNPGKCLTNEPQVIIGGNGVSGPTFVDNADYRIWVWETFEADALDMETAAVAHVAYTNQVPYIAFRSLSDLAGGGEGQNELPIFLNLAARNSSQMVIAFLETWD